MPTTTAKTTFTSEEFIDEVDEAKQAAAQGPVFIADKGVPTHVLLTISDYRRIFPRASISELLGNPEAAEIEFETPRLNLQPRHVDFD